MNVSFNLLQGKRAGEPGPGYWQGPGAPARPRPPHRPRCEAGEYYDQVVGLCSRCEDVCQAHKADYYDCKKLCPNYSPRSRGVKPTSDTNTSVVPVVNPKQSTSLARLGPALGHEGREAARAHGSPATLPALCGVLGLVVAAFILLLAYRLRRGPRRAASGSSRTENTGLMAPCNTINVDMTVCIQNTQNSTNATSGKDERHVDKKGVAVMVGIGCKQATVPVDSASRAKGESQRPLPEKPAPASRRPLLLDKEGGKTPASLSPREASLSPAGCGVSPQETPSTLLYLREDARQPGEEETHSPISLREATTDDWPSCTELTVPEDLPSPDPGGRNITQILVMLDWVVSSSSEGGVWNLILSPGADPGRAGSLIKTLIGLAPSDYRLGVMENSTMERQGIGDRDEGARGQTPLKTPVTVSRIPLRIGDKIQRPRLNRQRNVFEACSTTIGAFFTLNTPSNEQIVCAFTNCEGSTHDTRCFVCSAADGQEYELGRPLALIEGNFSVDRLQPGSARRTCVDVVFFDGMLIPVDLNRFEPSNEVSYEKNRIELQLYQRSVQELEGMRVHKLLPAMDPVVAGVIRSVNKTNKAKVKFVNSLEVTTQGPLRRSVSKRGECGTIMTSFPENGTTFLYGSLFGAYTMGYRTVSGGSEQEEYTAVYPLDELFKCILDRYHLQISSIELYRESQTCPSKGSHETGLDSGIATGLN